MIISASIIIQRQINNFLKTDLCFGKKPPKCYFLGQSCGMLCRYFLFLNKIQCKGNTSLHTHTHTHTHIYIYIYILFINVHHVPFLPSNSLSLSILSLTLYLSISVALFQTRQETKPRTFQVKLDSNE